MINKKQIDKEKKKEKTDKKDFAGEKLPEWGNKNPILKPLLGTLPKLEEN